MSPAKATFAAGCFWGVEHMFRKQFPQLTDARVGYMGGTKTNPTYEEVCRGNSGHAESLQLTYEPSTISYKSLVEFFYKMHDPTTPNRQGNDRGSQYRSAIFTHDSDQSTIARQVTKLANENWWKGKIVTEITEAGTWYDAEKYHQQYLHHNKGGYECPMHFQRDFGPLE